MTRGIKITAAKLIAIAFALHNSGNVMSQTTAPATSTDSTSTYFTDPTFILISLAVIILLVVILALAKTSMGLSKLYGNINKKAGVVLIFLLTSFVASAQETATQTAYEPTKIPDWVFNPSVYLVTVLFFVMLLTVYVLYKVNMSMLKALNPAKEKSVVELEVEAVAEKKPTWLRKVYLKMVDSVPVEKERDVMLDHDYDGIKELDNNLPPWWKYGFYVTIAFAFCYIIFYHVVDAGKLQAAEYSKEVRVAEEERTARLKANADNVTEDNVIALTDAGLITSGKVSFEKLCAACHLASGGGQVGPNLTDEYWLHGGGIKNIFKTITNGVPAKGMISWKAQLTPKQIQEVASYILTLQESKPADGKEQQGELWVEQPVTTDSLKTDSLKTTAVDSVSMSK